MQAIKRSDKTLEDACETVSRMKEWMSVIPGQDPPGAVQMSYTVSLCNRCINKAIVTWRWRKDGG